MAPPPITRLQPASVVAGDGAAIVFVTGPVHSSAIHLVNAALDLKIPSPPSDRPSAAAPELLADAAPSGPLVVALEGLDRPNVDPALALAVSLSGALVLAVRLPDLARPAACGIAPLMAAVERSLALRMSGAAPPLPTRRLLAVAVRDYEPDLVAPPDLRAALADQLAAAYDQIDVPHGFAGTQLSDLYDLHFVLLPSERHCPAQHAEALTELRDLLRDANKSYADAGMTPERVTESVDKIHAALSDNASSDLPADRELGATFACDAVMQSVLEKHRNNAKQWKATVDAGRIIRSFGTENDRLIERTLEVYDNDASVHKSTRAFQRKRDELKGLLLSDSYALFAKQILKVRENAYQVFRAKLARIRINEKVEKNVRGAVKEAEAFFVEHGESLRSKLGNWRFDNERHELVNHMRDDATERLQLARLQGNYVPPMRAPIAFAFHTLMLAPFGQDSRFAHPHAEDMKQSYDPDKVKQAGLMRARPHQRNVIFSVGGGAQAGNTIVERFADLYEDEKS